MQVPKPRFGLSSRQYPTKNGLTPPSSRSKVVIVRARSYAPSFRGFRLGTTSPIVEIGQRTLFTHWQDTIDC